MASDSESTKSNDEIVSDFLHIIKNLKSAVNVNEFKSPKDRIVFDNLINSLEEQFPRLKDALKRKCYVVEPSGKCPFCKEVRKQALWRHAKTCRQRPKDVDVASDFCQQCNTEVRDLQAHEPKCSKIKEEPKNEKQIKTNLNKTK